MNDINSLQASKKEIKKRSKPVFAVPPLLHSIIIHCVGLHLIRLVFAAAEPRYLMPEGLGKSAKKQVSAS